MKLRLLSLAETDLLDGFRFYEGQGVGSYFLDALYSDIESLRLYVGIHQRIYGYHRAPSKREPFALYYDVSEKKSVSGACWIAGEIHAGSRGS